MKISMDGKGARQDNVFVERLWAAGRLSEQRVLAEGREKTSLPGRGNGEIAPGSFKLARCNLQKSQWWSGDRLNLRIRISWRPCPARWPKREAKLAA
jgi:hypothetical protein